MLKDIKKILFAEIKEKITEYEEVSNRITEMNNKILELRSRQQEIQAVVGFAVSESKEVVKLNMPNMPSMIIKEFSFWDKWLFNRKEYKRIERLNKNAQEKYQRELKEYNEKKEKYNEEKSILEEETLKLKNKIKELEGKKNEDIRTRFEMIKSAKTLKELNLSFEEAKKILEDNNKQLILDESDKEITVNESNFDKPEDFILVHKTAYSPTDDEIKSSRNIKAKLKQTVYFGEEEFSYEYEKSRNTVHLCQNGEVSSHATGYFDDRKYAVLIPFKNVRNNKNLASFSPEDTFFDGKVNINEGYILCPIEEIETIKKYNPNSNVIGYEGKSVDGFAASFLSMLGYKHKKIGEHSWVEDIDSKKHSQFMGKNPDLHYKTHAYSYEYMRDDFLEKFNQIIGLTESLIRYKNLDKKYDVIELTEALFSSKRKVSVESGKNKRENIYVENGIAPSFTSLINKSFNPYSKENLYLGDFVQSVNFEYNSEDIREANANFLFYKLEEQSNIKIPQEIKEILSYNGEYENVEKFIESIQDEDTKRLLSQMKEDEEILNIDRAKDVVFLKAIIEQVYREQVLDKKELTTSSETNEAERY